MTSELFHGPSLLDLDADGVVYGVRGCSATIPAKKSQQNTAEVITPSSIESPSTQQNAEEQEKPLLPDNCRHHRAQTRRTRIRATRTNGHQGSTLVTPMKYSTPPPPNQDSSLNLDTGAVTVDKPRVQQCARSREATWPLTALRPSLRSRLVDTAEQTILTRVTTGTSPAVQTQSRND